MKILEIEEEVEKCLHTVYDVALKTAGIQALGLINKALAAVQPLENSLGKKCLKLEQETDQTLHAIFDAAFKAVGMNAYWPIQTIAKSIKDLVEEPVASDKA